MFHVKQNKVKSRGDSMEWWKVISDINSQDILILSILIVLMIWNIVITAQLLAVKKKYKKFMRGSSGKSIELALNEHVEKVAGVIDKVELLNRDIDFLKDKVGACIQKCNITRYNAFSDTGSDLSYSLALLDDFDNGVILSSIYGRNETVTYAKPINNGKSSYPLSIEEELVLERCLKS